MTLRIAMILNRYLPIIGGAERQASHLIRQLSENGHQVSVITRRIKSELSSIETIDGVIVKRLQPIGLSHRSNVLMFFRLLIYLLKNAHQYDIFHAHSVGPIGIATILAGKLTHTPVVLRIPSAGDISRIQKTPVSRYTSIVRRYILTQNLWIKLLAQASAIIILSDEIIEEAKAFQLDKIVHKIPNGVNIEDFDDIKDTKENLCQTIGISSSHHLIIYVGRLVQGKRIDVLLDAFSVLRETRPDTHVLLAGSGHLQIDDVEKELHEQVNRLNLVNHVTFLGLVDDIPRYLRAVDMFAFPSASEGMPNVILEAMAYKLPIVASRIGGITDIVDDTIAYLVPVGDVIAFADALRQIIDYPEIAQRKADGVRIRAEEKFSLNTVARQYEALYHSLLH